MDEYNLFRTLKLEIKFPFEPYGIQKVMMSTIVRTLMNREHSLIESPTGTGKTLSLLCSALAWQAKSKELKQPFISDRLKEEYKKQRIEKLSKKPCVCGKRDSSSELKENLKCKGRDKEGFEKGFNCQIEEDEIDIAKKKQKTSNIEEVELINISDDEADLCTSSYFDHVKEEKSQEEFEKKVKKESQLEDKEVQVITLDEGLSKKNCVPEKVESNNKSKESNRFCISCAALDAEQQFMDIINEITVDGADTITDGKLVKVPRIYYGTRTHKQIAQVVRELNKTPYKNKLKMCILSSRERTCIKEDVREKSNRNDLCQQLLKNKKESNNNSSSRKKSDLELCDYYSDSKTIGDVFKEINREYEDQAWDIEDAAEFGRKHNTCPYYGVRSLQMEADITFSPYNYLLDPTIRKALDICLDNSIVILDEAHNIEDICRESASFTIDSRQIDDILETITMASNKYLQGSTIMDAYLYFKKKLEDIAIFLKSYPFPPNQRETKVMMNQDELKSNLTTMGIGASCLKDLKEYLKALKGDEDENKSTKNEDKSTKNEDDQHPALSFVQMQIISQLSIALDFMYSNNQKHVDDFRCVISKALESDYYRFNSRAGKPRDQRRQNDEPEDRYIWQISLLCMSSGIAFQKIVNSSWSIVVASGTLSPIDSLKSELGCRFTNVFEGKHVIPSERIFASVISRGPNDVELDCGFQNSLRLDFQDEVGRVIRDVCCTVPSGVLCFFPSYDRMDTFYRRWFETGIMGQIQRRKKFFREKKNTTVADFEKELENYNIHAKLKGALLFAVFRGKVSEGIDFADNAARAVITVGIPYPNTKEVGIDLKRKYNDTARRKMPELMCGGDWYAAQGYRALNQALGRCIRHKGDWGAIIMIDSRLSRGINNISKWLKAVLQQSQNYSVNYDSLKQFVERLQEE